MVKAALIALVACVLALVGLAIADQINHNSFLNSWTARCNSDGGVAQTTRYKLTHNDLACIKNGKVINP